MSHKPYEKEWVKLPQASFFKDMMGAGLASVHKLIEPYVHLPDDTRILVLWEEITRVAEGYEHHDILRKRILMARDIFCMLCDEDTGYTRLILRLVAGLIHRSDEFLSSTGYRPTVEALKRRKVQLQKRKGEER